MQCLCYRAFSFSKERDEQFHCVKNVFCVPNFAFSLPHSYPFNKRAQKYLLAAAPCRFPAARCSVNISTLEDLWLQARPFFMPYCTGAKPLLQGHARARQAQQSKENPAFLMHCPAANHATSFLGNISLKNQIVQVQELWGSCEHF